MGNLLNDIKIQIENAETVLESLKKKPETWTILSISIGSLLHCNYTNDYWVEYCTRHGYTYERIYDSPNTNIHPKMHKYTQMLRILEETSSNVMFVDCDCMVTNSTISIESVLMNHGIRDLTVSRDIRWLPKRKPWIPINSGVLIMRNTEFSKRLLKRVLEEPKLPSRWKQFGLVDQPILTKVLYDMGELKRTQTMQYMSTHISIVSQRTINSFYRTAPMFKNDPKHSKWQPGDWIAHFTGDPKSMRLANIKRVISALHKQKTSTTIVIPYRDRDVHLKRFLQSYKDFSIIVVEQANDKPFNRAWLLNVGITLVPGGCIVTHDVDIIATDKSLYHQCHIPTQLCTDFSCRNKIGARNAGGVVMMSKRDWTKLNGYTNMAIGWGREDDDLAQRLRIVFGMVPIHRPPKGKGYCKCWTGKDHTKRIRDKKGFKRMGEKLKRMKHNSDEWKNDGLNSLRYSIISDETKLNYRHVKVTQIEFIHIPKTGGSAIEKAAAAEGISWGSCHFLHHDLRKEMKCPSDDIWKQVPKHGPSWHLPRSAVSYYDGKETFMVKRDPFERVLSCYYDRWRGYKGKPQTKQEMNLWVRKSILSGHFGEPQSAFEADTVLHFENLNSEFNAFAEHKGLPVRLREAFNVGQPKRYAVSDFDKETLNTISRWENIRDDLYLRSAYIDKLEKEIIIMAEIKKKNNFRDSRCKFGNTYADSVHIQKLDQETWIENLFPRLTHVQVMIHCKWGQSLPNTEKMVYFDNQYVTITSKRSKQITNNYEICFAVFRPGDENGFPVEDMLHNWITHHKKIGFNKINMYVASSNFLLNLQQSPNYSTKDKQTFMQHLKDGTINIIMWPARKPFITRITKKPRPKENWEIGDGRVFYWSQALALNDCVYRANGNKVMILDIDEFLTNHFEIKNNIDSMKFPRHTHNPRCVTNSNARNFWERFGKEKKINNYKAMHNSANIVDVGVHGANRCFRKKCNVKISKKAYVAHIRDFYPNRKPECKTNKDQIVEPES